MVAILYALFRASRRLLGLLIARIERNQGEFNADHALVLGFRCLVAGMLFLPLVTWGLAFADRNRLPGGLALHLFLVAVSIVLFSFAEDLFAGLSKYPRGALGAVEHWKTTGPLLLAFWILGASLISPIFYSAMAFLLALFHAYAITCRSRRTVPQPGR